MPEGTKTDQVPGTNRTTADRRSDREFVVTRTFDGPAHLVYQAWTRPELFSRWWAPRSFGLTILSCDMDVRTGGSYRLEIGHPARDQPMSFFGRYIEATPPCRLVWTNDEAGEGAGAVTTVTFEEKGGRTLVVLTDLYPSKEALDEAIASDATSGFAEQFDQLDGLLAA